MICKCNNLIAISQNTPDAMMCKNCGKFWNFTGKKLECLGTNLPREIAKKVITPSVCINFQMKGDLRKLYNFENMEQCCNYCELADKENHNNCVGESVLDWYDCADECKGESTF